LDPNRLTTKPFGFMPFYPGPGLGEPCIPIDPFNLTWKAREFGMSTRFIELAYKANVDNDRESPGYVLMDKLAAKGASVAYYDPFIRSFAQAESTAWNNLPGSSKPKIRLIYSPRSALPLPSASIVFRSM
jgi:UDP-N-acetyl-D-mannosaminuronate dehydrogenase